MEIKMQKRIFIILGVVLTTALTIQMASAAPRHARKTAHATAAQQFRGAYDSRTAPAASGNKSCDVIWCYSD
jgi:hypothetical protein